MDDNRRSLELDAVARLSVNSREFWTHAYSLRTDAKGAPACADFLAPAAAQVLDAGKALLLLRSGKAAASRWRLIFHWSHKSGEVFIGPECRAKLIEVFL